MDSARVQIVDDAEAGRYELGVDGELAGQIAYSLHPDAIALNHTEVDERFEGEGLGGQLARFALEDARRRGLAVLPFCPFVRAYLKRHPEFVELVPEARRPAFGL